MVRSSIGSQQTPQHADIILLLDDPAQDLLTVLAADNTTVSILSNILGHAL